MENPAKEINTSNLAKLYRTTTGDIEKKLNAMGHKPLRTVVMQSGRRFMVWDKKATIESLDAYKARRAELLKEREEVRKELAEKQRTVPRTGPHTQHLEANLPSDFVALDSTDTVRVPKDFAAAMLKEMQALREYVQGLERQLADRKEAGL